MREAIVVLVVVCLRGAAVLLRLALAFLSLSGWLQVFLQELRKGHAKREHGPSFPVTCAVYVAIA